MGDERLNDKGKLLNTIMSEEAPRLTDMDKLHEMLKADISPFSLSGMICEAMRNTALRYYKERTDYENANRAR